MKALKIIISMIVMLSVMVALASGAYGAEKTTVSSKDKDNGLININTAGVDQLIELPRIGEKMAARIIEYRKKNGKFKKKEDLMKVKGIGEKTFKGFEHMITV
jgi:competence protein ComEA